MKKVLCAAMALLLLAALVAGCAPANPGNDANPPANNGSTTPPADTNSPADTTTDPGAAKKIAFITGTGGLGDKNLNDFTFAGAQLAEADGVVVDVVQPKDPSDFANLQRLYAEDGSYAVIICVAFDQADALAETAAAFPDQKFILCDGMVDAPNVTNLFFRSEETGFQLGLLAGLLEKEGALPNARGKNTIGFIGGMDIGPINIFLAGYEAGAKLVNPDVTVLSSYVGDWADPTTATELSTAQYENGADIIFACAGGSGLGVFTAAEEKGGYALGIETNQNGLAPDYIIASGARDWSIGVYAAINEALAGTLQPGNRSMGIADGSITIARDGSNVQVSEEIMAAINEHQAKVVDGTYKLPQTREEVPAFLAGVAG